MPSFTYYDVTTGMSNPRLATTAPLSANGSWTSDTIATGGNSFVVGSVFADQAGTIYIEQSVNGTNWDISTSYDVAANDGKGFKEDVILDYVRVRYANGPVAQTAFRLDFSFRS